MVLNVNVAFINTTQKMLVTPYALVRDCGLGPFGHGMKEK